MQVSNKASSITMYVTYDWKMQIIYSMYIEEQEQAGYQTLLTWREMYQLPRLNTSRLPRIVKMRRGDTFSLVRYIQSPSSHYL